jgi:adenine deaminase
MKKEILRRRIAVGAGRESADLVLKNCQALDVFSGLWVKGDIAISDGWIAGIGESYRGKREVDCFGKYVVPGFIDAHVHIESTMMLPSEFARAVLPHGTTSIIWDPHEIANVFGVAGLEWAIECAQNCAVDLFVMLSSCVPSSKFENSGATISAEDLQKLKHSPHVLGLAEMMDFPSVINGNDNVLDKLLAFADKPRDGHSPLLMGKDLNAYIAGGVSTCHEVCTLEEAQQKLSRGMRVMIREGSVAKNASTMVELLSDYSSPHCFLCTDDRNPLDIANEGHLDFILRLAMQRGVRPEVAYRSVSHSAALHYGLTDRGAVAPGHIADLVILDDLQQVKIFDVLKFGRSAKDPDWKWPASPAAPSDESLKIKPYIADCLAVKATTTTRTVKANAIGVIPNQILTTHTVVELPVLNSLVQTTNKVQKIAIFERHKATGNIGIGFVTGFDIVAGAIASSVAHDAHNIGVIGSDDQLMLRAVEEIKRLNGGIVVIGADGQVLAQLALPVAGLMSKKTFDELVPEILALRTAVKQLGCPLEEPFLQMSFLALPVIPTLKITDLGLVDVNNQKIIPVLVE